MISKRAFLKIQSFFLCTASRKVKKKITVERRGSRIELFLSAEDPAGKQSSNGLDVSMFYSIFGVRATDIIVRRTFFGND